MGVRTEHAPPYMLHPCSVSTFSQWTPLTNKEISAVITIQQEVLDGSDIMCYSWR